jgi:hypothetical protein
MIIVKVMGGLGNQLFQYVFGRVLSIRLKKQVYYDISEYYLSSTNIKRELVLNQFPNIIAKYVNSKLVKLALKLNIAKTIREKNFSFIKFEQSPYIINYLNGYWQDYNYINEFRTTICNELFMPSMVKNKYYDRIKHSNSVSLHIRLSDYLLPQNQNIYHQLSLKYYTDSIDLINLNIGKPTIFVFSDDIEKSKIILNSIKGEIVFVDDNSSFIEDFGLMRMCSHNIIANSTFSWWAAWLNQYNNKTVIAPKQWYKDRVIDNIYPNKWIQI